MSFPISIAQLNFVVGDIPGNTQKIIEAAREAHAQGARLLLTPELALTAYAAEDLYLRPAFLSACDKALAEIATATAGFADLTLVVGHPDGIANEPGHRCHNAASVIRNGRIEQTYAKQRLPNYEVFDEQRYFIPGNDTCVFEVDGVRMGLLICEDAWYAEPAKAAANAGAQLLVCINASPFHLGKTVERENAMRARVAETGLPLVYAHLYGGQDEVVFEGASFALNADGQVAMRAASFAEELASVNVQQVQGGAIRLSGDLAPVMSWEAELWAALVTGVRDYIGKNGFPGVVLGLSGGIDSALVLAVAVDALGADRVRTVMMPSPYTADISWIDAREMAARLHVQYQEIAIAPQFEAFKAALAADFAGLPEDTTEENLQARIRGMLLMALSNKFGSLVLTTGNKSEMATGYCTLYGDMAGGFAVIKDVLKTRVFALARWRNAHDPFGTGLNPIPERIITRPPSAELRPDQKDQDSLPPYEVLDAIVERYMERDEAIADIVAAGFSQADVDRVTRLIKINEYKRRQAAVGVRVTRRSFGKDWRYPITNKFRA
ncbi:NAD+ synthase [Diaphorobacter aerolatus]|uniref:Glutamine-dependent NAD(+) synthetase n=1 Tax=Diaphorobacter aerolatus TaxID=1288495 RepID=A0A7H0GLA8_9BURK|nr:NAD+ synthase [Diaphorobacter aerolatus]QNP49074.1 NAD+ synthase [Diaphorobacter aerolatus]